MKCGNCEKSAIGYLRRVVIGMPDQALFVPIEVPYSSAKKPICAECAALIKKLTEQEHVAGPRVERMSVEVEVSIDG